MASGNANTVTLTFAGDSKQLDRTFATVDAGAKDFSKSVETANEKAGRFSGGVDGVAESMDNSESKLLATNDLISGFADTMGIALPPQASMIMGFADMAGGLAGLLPSLSSAKGAMTALNTTMRANPILTVVTVLALLTTAFIVAYKKSETFRNIVHGALDGVKVVAESVGDAFGYMFDMAKWAFDGIAKAAQWLWDHSPLGMIVNNLDKIAGFGGKVLGSIPGFANGGRPTGLSIVGERGPEYLVGDGHSRVIPMTGGSGGSQSVTVEFDFKGDQEMVNLFQKAVRVRGGNVQQVLGGR